MRVDGQKIALLRQSKAMTQEKLALLSNVHVRTIQRAEQSLDLGLETVSLIAAALEVPQLEIMQLHGDGSTGTGDPAENPIGAVADGDPAVTVLKIERSADRLLQIFERCFTCKIDVGVSLNEQIAKTVLTFSEQIEPYLPNPTPPRHRMLGDDEVHSEVQRIRTQLAATTKISDCLRQLEAAGLALYVGYHAAYGRIPSWDVEENCWSISGRQEPEPILIAIIRIGRPSSERQSVKIAPLTDWWA